MKKVLAVLFKTLVIIFLGYGVSGAGTLITEIIYKGSKRARFWVVSEQNLGLGNVAVEIIPINVDVGDENGDKREIDMFGWEAEENNVMDNLEKAYTPHVIVVKKGSDIIHRNSDPFYHAPRIHTPEKIIAVDLHKQGDEKTIVIDNVGIYKVTCDNHGKESVMPMIGYIVVTEAEYFGVTDWYGKLVIEDILPGEYRLKMWHEGLGERNTEVVVKEDGETYVKYSY